MRADQYLMEGQRALEQKDPAAAVEAFKKVEALPVDPPVDFAFWYGQALVEHGISQNDVGMVNKGEGFLKQYLIETGRESEHYTSALALLSRAEGHGLPRPQRPTEDVKAAAQDNTETEPPQKAEIKPERCDDNLWGVWTMCSNRPTYDLFYISHSIGKDGIETVTLEEPAEFGFIGGYKHTYRVDRKWRTGVAKYPGETSVSCRGWNDYGYRTFSILQREGKGVFPAYYSDFFVDNSDTLFSSHGKIYKEKDGELRREEVAVASCERAED